MGLPLMRITMNRAPKELKAALALQVAYPGFKVEEQL